MDPEENRVGGGVAPAVLPHHRTYSSYPAVSVNVVTLRSIRCGKPSERVPWVSEAYPWAGKRGSCPRVSFAYPWHTPFRNRNEVVVHRIFRRILLGQHPPRTSRASDVKQPIEHLPHVDFAWASTGLGGRYQTRNCLPLLVSQVCWVFGFHAAVSVGKKSSSFHRRVQIPAFPQLRKTFPNTLERRQRHPRFHVAQWLGYIDAITNSEAKRIILWHNLGSKGGLKKGC